MPSLQSRLLRPFLHLQKAAQGQASIDGVRRASRRAETPRRLPKGLRLESVQADSVHLEWYLPHEQAGSRVLLHLHGGGFVFPLWNPLRRVMYQLALQTGLRVAAVHYRLAPEHPYPAALEDCLAAYRWLIGPGGLHASQILLIGESAGANLVMATALALRDAGDPLPAKLVGISGVYDLPGVIERFTVPGPEPMLHGPFVRRQILAYVGESDPTDPLISPVCADLHGLPPVYLQAGADEFLRADSEQLAARIYEARGKVKLDLWPHMWHFWHLFAPFLPEAREAIEALAEFVKQE